MCGICGYISNTNLTEDIIVSMNNMMIHRGPDSSGYYRKNNIALAMKRLAILDLKTGDQPIYNSNKSKLIIYNGEVYNYKEIRKELQNSGSTFATNSDTEVILQGYEKYGLDVLNRLNGMFSIALYDEENKQLIIARDRLGIKPLFYFHNDGNFVFASEIKAILKYPSYKKDINYSALDHLLKYKYILGEHSIFKDIKKILPGYYMIINHDGKIVRYSPFWEIENYIKTDEIPSYDEAKLILREKLQECVKKRMIADVPLGTFLSGGIDSCIITGLMSKESSIPIKTFSIGFTEKTFNELKWAEITAKKYRTDHQSYIVKAENILELLDELVFYTDEPTGNYGMIPSYYVNKYSKPNVTVALSGLGADEIFAGYERYWINKMDNLYSRSPLFLQNGLSYLLNHLPVSSNKKSIVWRLRKVINEINKPLPLRYDYVLRLLNDEDIKNLYTEDIVNKTDSVKKSFMVELFDTVKDLDFIKQTSYTDIKTILVDDYLFISDRMSMANSLEVRTPFLDHELVEFAFKVKSTFKLNRMKTKYILKDTFSDLIPKQILNRGKYGFEAPFNVWLKNNLKYAVKELLLDSNMIKNKIFNKNKINEIFNQHIQNKNNYSKLIFTLVTLELWLRKYFPIIIIYSLILHGYGRI